MATSFLFLHGWQGSEAEHWQRWLARELAARGHAVRFPDFAAPDQPALARWLPRLSAELETLEPAGTTVLCHSLGCYLWLHHANSTAVVDPVARVLLVAPPTTDYEELYPDLRGIPLPALDAAAVARAATSTAVVYGTDDPYFPGGARRIADELEIPAHELPGGGHVNVAAGYGPWPAALAWAEGTAGF
jgi:predicted alpha/beta hydrolase family esterase